ncbi:hypothetical protein [Nostoc sp. DedQUE07]|uniref:hypothetical protein n=1 Tax=Nostoc sp. DedQUE07 TaxID=3075392 RepID=UPI002AD24D79|nr:hypothetical protein [Nostoc sp. DedQUE07]MDZ8131446.1 hypothetical protein [Nostoc sp. DedQUE07]
MNSPTDEQAALIKITLEGTRMAYPDRFDQENLLNLHKAKMHLEMVVGLLGQSRSRRSPTSLKSRGSVALNCSSVEYKVFFTTTRPLRSYKR